MYITTGRLDILMKLTFFMDGEILFVFYIKTIIH